jgi:hypothetical protein
MKSLIASVSFCMLMLAAAPASADVVEFEAQAANRGGNLTGFPDSPLTIGIATFTGGELRHGLINFPADETGVYASEGLFGPGETNQLVISFATPVRDFSVLVANGDSQNQTYTVSDDLGDSKTFMLALSGSLSNAATTVSLPGDGIRSVLITSANTEFWNFAIDNVTFTAVSEPRKVKIFMQRDCSIGAGRRDVLDSGCHVADRAQAEQGRGRGECCFCLDGCVLRDTTQQHNTHITDVREICYSWHPWHGRAVRVHASLVAELAPPRDPVWSKNSCGITVVLQYPAEALPTAYSASGLLLANFL